MYLKFSSAECCKELIYLKNLLYELTGENVPAEINIDNLSTIDIIKKGVIHKRSKHIEVRYHYIKEKYDCRSIGLKYCPTEIQIADLLTRPEKFNVLKKNLIS